MAHRRSDFINKLPNGVFELESDSIGDTTRFEKSYWGQREAPGSWCWMRKDPNWLEVEE